MKDCLLIAPINGLKYKDMLPLFIKDNVRTGISSFNQGMYFYVPETYEYENTYKFDREKEGEKAMRYPSVCWLTTFKVLKHFEPTEEYSPDKYPKYENYDAIEVNDYRKIPNYPNEMGVPITFLHRYNPKEYDILDNIGNAKLNGKTIYARLIIRRKQL